MPVYLRNFYMKKLVDIKKKENTEVEKAKSKNKISKPPSKFTK
tara:strand:- start:389 stop:517 length:129 start_codon:yes stop_codon:yes gene_type:complete